VDRPPGPLEVGIGAFAVLQLALALLMAAAPHSFYTAVGPFGAYNGHYIRDVATFYAALGAGLAISLRRPSWRVPALAMTTIQYALHQRQPPVRHRQGESAVDRLLRLLLPRRGDIAARLAHPRRGGGASKRIPPVTRGGPR
jgi:hypothetical protein